MISSCLGLVPLHIVTLYISGLLFCDVSMFAIELRAYASREGIEIDGKTDIYLHIFTHIMHAYVDTEINKQMDEFSLVTLLTSPSPPAPSLGTSPCSWRITLSPTVYALHFDVVG